MVNLISQELNELINKQIVEELRSAYIYLGMSAWALEKGLKGLANFMKIHAEKEEYKHAMKFAHYIQETGGKVKFGTLEHVTTDYENAEDLLKAAIKHEEYITNKIKELMDLATSKNEYYAYDLLNWFIQEQIEEENLFTDLYNDFLLSGKMLGVWDHHIKHPD
ncbi:MAG: ferritin [Candidatus Thorarchaeota archaeon]